MTARALVDRDLLDDVRARVGTSGTALDDAAVRDALRATGRVFGSAALSDLARAARAELTGAGPLQELLDAPDVTDVLVNGPRDVWVDRGDGLRRVDLDLGTPDAVRALAVRMAAVAGQRLDDAAPTVDARMPDGMCQANTPASVQVSQRPQAVDAGSSGHSKSPTPVGAGLSVLAVLTPPVEPRCNRVGSRVDSDG